jgi:hypothetical protein
MLKMTSDRKPYPFQGRFCDFFAFPVVPDPMNVPFWMPRLSGGMSVVL